MDRSEYEAQMAKWRRQREDLDIARGTALFAVFQRAMQMHAENRDSLRDQGWRDAMIGIAEAFDAAVGHALNEANIVLQRDLD